MTDVTAPLVSLLGHTFSLADLLASFALLLLLALGWVLLRAQFDPKSPIDFNDLLLDYTVTKDPREKKWKPRLTRHSFFGLVGFVFGLFAFIFSLLLHTLDKDWGGIVAFMGICFGVQVGGGWVAKQISKNGADDAAPPRGGLLSGNVDSDKDDSDKDDRKD